MDMNDKYEVNDDTLAVIGVSNNKTRIIEYNSDFLLEDNAYQVIDYSCNYFGSSYKGRVEGTKNILGCKNKVPVIIEESKEIIFFPTTSPELSKCCWISLSSIEKIDSCGKNSIIYLKNNKKIFLNVSKQSIDNQIFRATRLKYLLNTRKKEKSEKN